MGFSEIAASRGSWKRGHVAYRCLLGNRLWRGDVAADLNDGSDETNDSAGGRGQGLYDQTRRLSWPLLRPTECGSGSLVDRLVFGLGDASRAPSFSLFIQVTKKSTRDEE